MQHIGTTGMLQYAFLKMFFLLYLPVYTRYIILLFSQTLKRQSGVRNRPCSTSHIFVSLLLPPYNSVQPD